MGDNHVYERLAGQIKRWRHKACQLAILVAILIAAPPALRAQTAAPIQPAPTETLIIATSEAWPPYSFVDQDGTLRGMLIDFWREYARQNNLQPEFKASDWKTTLKNVKTGQADIHAGLFYNLERDQYLDFSRSMPVSLASRLFVSRKLTVTGLKDLEPLSIGVTTGGFAESYLRKHHPALQTQGYPNSLQVIKAAMDGKILAFVVDYPAAIFYLKQLDATNAFYVVETLYTRSLQAAVAQGRAASLQALNRGLAAYPENKIKPIVRRWVRSPFVTPPWLAPVAATSLGGILLIVTLFYLVVMRRQLNGYKRNLEIATQTDDLTGILNRRHIESMFALELYRRSRYQTSLSIIMADLDHLKQINESHGHAVGDAVLAAFAERIRHIIRKSDLFGRWSGEEFLIICPETDLHNACILAEKLRAEIEDTAFADVGQRTASFGVVEALSDESTREIFIRVDLALCHSKAKGRNCVTCGSSADL